MSRRSYYVVVAALVIVRIDKREGATSAAALPIRSTIFGACLHPVCVLQRPWARFRAQARAASMSQANAAAVMHAAFLDPPTVFVVVAVYFFAKLAALFPSEQRRCLRQRAGGRAGMARMHVAPLGTGGVCRATGVECSPPPAPGDPQLLGGADGRGPCAT